MAPPVEDAARALRGASGASVEPAPWARGRRRARLGVAIGALCASLVAGCTDAADPTAAVTSPSPTPTVQQPIVAGALPMATDLRPANVEDPYTERALGLMLRGLVRYDAKGMAVNEMAQSIETSDNQVFTVRIAGDWTFTDGEPVTARSYVDAWNYAARSDTGQYRARDFAPILGYEAMRRRNGTAGTAQELAGLEVVDDYTFRITLDQPQPGFPTTLGQLSFAPLPSKALADPTAWSRNPTGNGPYRLDGTWPADPAGGTTIRLRPNPGYRGGQPPQNTGIDLRVYDTAAAAYADLRSGTLDVLDQVPVSELARHRTEFGTRAVNQPVGVAQSIVFPTFREPWKGERGVLLRQAISTSIDRSALASGLLAATAIPATDLAAPVVEGYATDLCGQWCTRDQSLATRSLAEAGGWEGPLTIAYTQDDDNGPVATEVCREVTQALTLPCETHGYPTLRALREAVALGTETGPYLETWRMSRPALANFLMPRFSTGSPDNGSGFSDALVDTRFKAALTAATDAQPAAFAQIEPLILSSLPVVPLWSRNAVGGHGTGVSAARTDVFGSPVYAQITRP